MTSSKPNNIPRSVSARIASLIGNYPRQIIGIILVLGILLSAIVITGNPASLKTGETDSWWTIALNLAHRDGYSLCLPQYFPFCDAANQVTATREPAPVLLFTFAAWLGKDSLLVAELLEAMIYLTLIFAIYRLTLEWTTPGAAVIASFLWAIYLPALELLPQVSGDLLAALFTTLGILFTLRARKNNRVRDWLLAGISLGFAVMSRSATLVVVLVILGGQVIDSLRRRGKLQVSLRPAFVVFSSVVTIMAPWLIRNQLALGSPILGSSLTGYNLYRHNYMIEEDDFIRYVGAEEAAKAIQALLTRRADLRGNENEAEMDAVYRKEALNIIGSHPIRYGLLSAYRFFPLWFDWKIAEAYGRQPNRYDYFIMLLQAALLILAFLGIRKRAEQTWPLWGSILMLSLAYMAVDARLLYVMPVMPLVISLSAAGTIELLKKMEGEEADSSMA